MSEILTFGAVVVGLAAFGLYRDRIEHRDQEVDPFEAKMNAYNLLAKAEKEQEKAACAGSR